MHFFIFLVAVSQLVILSDRTMHLMTSSPDYLPLGDIIQGHFHKSYELLIKFVLWLWLTAGTYNTQELPCGIGVAGNP